MRRLALIMAGGHGERFWPLSRMARPKQLLPLGRDGKSLLEEAVERVSPIVGQGNVYLGVGKGLKESLSATGVVPSDFILVEPAKKGTLGCVCWAAANLLAQGAQQTAVAVLTADHAIGDPAAFREAVASALSTAEVTGGLALIGIRPTRPETGYGYVELNPQERAATGAAKVAKFHEKPNLDTAVGYAMDPNFLWNSGMFFWTLDAFLSELEGSEPEAYRLTHAMAEALGSAAIEAAERLFGELRADSVDYAVLEKAKRVFVVEGTFAWDDLGAWDALSRVLPKDERGNILHGDAIAADCRQTIVYNADPTAVACALGLEGMVVAVTEDAVLVCPVDQAQRVRELVRELRERGAKQV